MKPEPDFSALAKAIAANHRPRVLTDEELLGLEHAMRNGWRGRERDADIVDAATRYLDQCEHASKVSRR